MYRLEKQMEPNVAVELDSTLESQSTLEFCLVRENSEFGQHTTPRKNINSHLKPAVTHKLTLKPMHHTLLGAVRAGSSMGLIY